MALVVLAPGQVRVGPLVARWRWPAYPGTPMVQRCRSEALRPDLSRERFTGWSVHRPGGAWALAVLRAERIVAIPRPPTPPRAWDRRRIAP